MPWTAFINELAQQGETIANKNVWGVRSQLFLILAETVFWSRLSRDRL